MTPRPPPAERSVEQLLEFGVLNLDKPAGPTSHQVSTWVSSLCDVRTGHAGTLDPGVTGCLPILLGDATRLAEVLGGATKGYVAVVEFHDSLPADWQEVIAMFEADLYQRPPRRSAVSRRLRTREVTKLEVLERNDRRALLDIECEAGTYVRKLCHDIGVALGTGAHMVALRRTHSTPFDDRSLVTLHDLADALVYWRDEGSEAITSLIDPGERALDHLPSITITDGAAEAVSTGAPVFAPGLVDSADVENSAIGASVACYTPKGTAVCVGTLVGDPSNDTGIVVDLDRVLI